MDLEELNARGARDARRLVALRLQRRQERLEPLEGARVLADPDELNTSETGWGVRPVAEMPDILENGGPGRHADTSSDQDSNLVLEDILSRGAVGPVNEETGHLLAILERYLIHAQRVDAVVELGLCRASTDGIAECASEVTHLADVDGDVGVVWAGGDGEGVPLELGDARDLEEEPLAGLVLERRLAELDLDDILDLVSSVFLPG